MKKNLSAVLAMVLLVTLLAGCGIFEGLRMEDLSGTWVTLKPDSREEAMGLLEMIDAYEEEIALADVDSLEYVKFVTFNEDGTYGFGYDIEGTMACVRDFYDRYFDALYEGRTQLNEAYNETFDDMTRPEFKHFFAQVYSYSSYNGMLDAFTERAYDYERLEEPVETGRFTISGNKLLLTKSGESQEEFLKVILEEDTMTLVYIDGQEVYTRD